MATKKINVRSPFYVEVNAQSPPSPTAPAIDATFYQWGGVINYSDSVGTLKTDLSSYTQAQLESEFICAECNGPSETSNKRSQYGFSQFKSKRLPMQVGDQVYDENQAALTVAATRGTIAYGIEGGKVLETGINPCQKSTATLGGQPVYKQYLSHIYTWNSSGIITAVKVPQSDCEALPVIEQDVSCSELISIGEDVGNRRYILDTTNKTGNFTVTLSASTPVQILTTVNGVQTDQKFVGGDLRKQELLDLGVASSQLVNLTSGKFGTGSFTLNKTSSNYNKIIVEIRAPLVNDAYSLTVSCPANNSRNAAPSVTGTSGSLINGSESIILAFLGNGYQADFPSQTSSFLNQYTGLEILINNVVVKTMTPAQLSWSTNKSFVLTNITGAEYVIAPGASSNTNGVKSPILVNASSMKKEDNRIAFRFTTSDVGAAGDYFINSSSVLAMRTALFYSGGSYYWASPDQHYQYSNYGEPSLAQSRVRVLNKFGSYQQMGATKRGTLKEVNYQIQQPTSTTEFHMLEQFIFPYSPFSAESETISPSGLPLTTISLSKPHFVENNNVS